jgi:hypothetical protein
MRPKLVNTKETAIFIEKLDEYNVQPAKYVKFNCEKCGRLETKRDVSIEHMIDNSLGMKCGPCLRKEGTFKKHGSETWNNPEKNKKTCLEKYGVDNGSKRPDIIEYIRCNNKANEKSTRDKFKQTCIQKYGVDNPAKSKIIREKIEQTCLKKYGVKAPAQNPKIFKKCAWKNIKYEGIYFDSSWELAFWIWNKNHNIDIKRNTKGFKLTNGSYCYPDFIIDGQLIEIKGDHLKKQENYKYKKIFYEKNNVKVYSYKELLPLFREVYLEMKNKNLPLPKIQKKRKIYEISSVSEIYSHKNENCKFQYICESCNTMVITGFDIIKHFNNLKCKKCRKSEGSSS